MLPSLLIVDDFLANPDEARDRALALDYDASAKRGNYPGTDSTSPLRIEELDEAVSKLVGVPLKGAAGTSHGHCRITLKNEKGRSGVHIDPAYYSGILYLSLADDCPSNGRGGTEFFRHKRTGLDRVPSDPLRVQKAGYADINALIEDVVNRDTNSPSKWERVMRIPIRYNRLILFSPWLFHNAGAAFGTSPENGRLVQVMFFAKGDAG